MIRQFVLGAVAAVSVGLGSRAATAHEPVRVLPAGPVVPAGVPIGGPLGGPIGGPVGGFVPPRVDYDFVVYVGYRHRDHFHWERYGRYETRREAERVEWFLERQGYRARVEAVRDRTPDCRY